MSDNEVMQQSQDYAYVFDPTAKGEDGDYLVKDAGVASESVAAEEQTKTYMRLVSSKNDPNREKTRTEKADEAVYAAQARKFQAGYAGAAKAETKPGDWVFMPVSGGSGAVYFNLSDPFTAYSAKVMDSRIPMKYWEVELDEIGNAVMRANKTVKVSPSESHLARPEFEIQKVAINPHEGSVYIDANGQRCLNQWRPFVAPPRPAEEFFKVGEIVKDWLELIYPGRADYVMDVWAHSYQRLSQKANLGLVFGGGHGIGKDTLLSIATHSFSKQGKVSNIQVAHLTKSGYEEFLLNPILIVGEFHTFKGDTGDMANKLKSYAAAPPHQFSVDVKYKPLTVVENIHRLYVTTNHEDRFPRENGDRRFMILKSHSTKEQVRAFIDERIGKGVDLKSWIDAGAGDAFTHILLERDISGFDCKNLPEDAADHDEVKKGFDIEPILASSFEEISETFGKWSNAVAADVEEIEQKHWPDFVTSQQILHSRAAHNPDLEGERAATIKGRRGHLDVLMNTAGYQPVIRPEGKAQWIGKKPGKNDRIGTVRVQSSALYIRRESIEPGEKVSSMQERAAKFIEKLSEYWKTENGIATYICSSANNGGSF
jgi:hypothetical protein